MDGASDETADADENTDASDETADGAETDDENADEEPVIEYGDEAVAPTEDAATGDGLDVEAEAAPTESIAFEADSFSVYAVVVTETIEARYIAADGQNYIISVGYGPEAEIPAGAELKVQEITGEENAEAYGWYTQKCVEAVDLAMFNPLTFARVFDIEIVSDGQKIEPAAEVAVSIRLADAPQMNDDTSVKVVHFEIENGPVVLDPEADENADLHFNTASFSVYAVIAYNGNPTGPSDLDGRTCTISRNGNYMTSGQAQARNITGLGKSNSENQAAIWKFEAAGMNDSYSQYYVSTVVEGMKKYLDITPGHWDNSAYFANVELSDTPVAITVGYASGKYSLSKNISEAGGLVFVNEIDGTYGNCFGGYRPYDINNAMFSFNFREPTQTTGKRYAVVAKKKGTDECYSVQNDGSLKAVTYDANLNQVTLGSPRLWEYAYEDGKKFLRHEEEGYQFNNDQLAGANIHTYLDPSENDGISSDEVRSWNLPKHDNYNNKDYYDTNDIIFVNKDNVNLVVDDQHQIHNTSGKYLAIHDNGDDTKSLVGNRSGGDSEVNEWEFYLAEVSNMPSGHGWNTNTVSHIDIGIEGNASATVPIPYGRYRNANGEEVVINTNQRVALTNDNVSIAREDLEGAEIAAFKKNGDAVQPINEVFYITGYSTNAASGNSLVQVRLAGVFTVAKGATLDALMTNGSIDVYRFDHDQTYRNQVLAARIAPENRIYYSVTLTKPVVFELKDKNGNPLYELDRDENGNLVRATTTVNVTLSASFDYWDSRNDCPPIRQGRYYNNNEFYNGEWVKWNEDEWKRGAIWRNNGSGMDFILGGSTQAERGTYAMQITKTIEDENGNPIKLAPNTRIDNNYFIYKNASASPNSVIALNVGGYEYDPNLTGYNQIDQKSTAIGQNGIGTLFAFDLTGGMYTIREDTSEQSLPRTVVDADGEVWTYKETYIQTEYVRRNGAYEHANDPMHHSKTYTGYGDDYFAIPEVLGEYPTVDGTETRTEDYLEYFVHNVYVPAKTELTVEKKWVNGDAPTGATVDVVLKRYKLVKQGGITPPEPTTATLVIRDSYTGLTGDRTYSATYNVTGPNYNETFTGNGSDITIANLPLGEYTITKQADAQEGYDMGNGSGSKAVTLRATGKVVSFDATQYTSTWTGSYGRVIIKSNDDRNTTPGGFVWVNEEYRKGSTLKFTVGVPEWNNNSIYSYSINGGATVSIHRGQTVTEEFVVNGDTTIIIYGDTPYYGNGEWLEPQPTLRMISTGYETTNGANAAPKFMRSAPRMMSAAASASQALVLTKSANMPAAPEDYEWQEDTTWCDGEGYLVQLSNGHWSETVDELDKQDSFGNVYVYYIDSVIEYGMPSGMSARIDMAGSARMLVYGDHEENKDDTLSVTNTLPTETDIVIKKVDKEDTGKLLNGAVFKLCRFSDAGCTQPVGDPRVVTVNGTQSIANLSLGYYKLVETTCPAGYVKTCGDPTFQVRQNPTTKEVEVVFTNTNMVEYDSANNTFTVKNEAGVRLPSTGGAGTGAYTAGGAALVLLAVALLLMKRRHA